MNRCTCNAPIPLAGDVEHARGCPADENAINAYRTGWKTLGTMRRSCGIALPFRGLITDEERETLVRVAKLIERGWAARR